MALRLGPRATAIAGALALSLLLTGSGVGASTAAQDKGETGETASEGFEGIVSGRVIPNDSGSNTPVQPSTKVGSPPSPT
jgi:hypothetical protein